MVLRKSELLELWRQGDLVLEPLLDELQFDSAKVDLRLDNFFLSLHRGQVDHYEPLPHACKQSELSPPSESFYPDEISYHRRFVLHPGQFALGQTLELVGLPDYCFGMIEGRSSLARRGILVHITANGIDPGFVGPICLELYNVGPVAVHLRPGMRVAALTLHYLEDRKSQAAPDTPGAGQSPAYADDLGKKFGADLRRHMEPQKADREGSRLCRAFKALSGDE